MAVNLSAFAGAGAQFFNDSGVPLSGGLLYSYAAGTTTPATTWTTNSGTVANTNPIVLDSAGRTPAEIWITSGADYKFILKTSTGITVGTYDDIPSLNDFAAFNNLITVTGTNSLIGTSVPPYTAYTKGMTLSFVPIATNTGAVTLDLDGLGAKSVTFDASTALSAGAIAVGKIATLQYDGTRFQLTNSVNTGQIVNGAVTATKLATDSVTTIKILDANVTAAKLATDSVTTIKIANSNVTPAKLSQPFTQATSVASTSGTSIDFTGIPSWVKCITIMFHGVSTNGISAILIQGGNSGGIVSSGYNSTSTHISQSNTTAGGSSTSGFIFWSNSSSYTHSGIITLTNLSGAAWVSSHAAKSSNLLVVTGGGDGSISTLDRVRITTVGGTDTFDAGSINILYE